MPKYIRVSWAWVKSQTFEKWAGVLTSSYLSLFLVVGIARSKELMSLPLNELGDFAAGVFGPLAFLWLVLGYRQQGRELANSNAALSMQAEELRSLVENQKVANENYERSVEPLFALSYLGEMGGDRNNIDRFELVNQGGHCKRLKIKIYGEGVSDSTEHLGEMASGGARQFCSNCALQSFGFYRFSLSYESISGKHIVKEIVGMRFQGPSGSDFNLIVDYDVLPRKILDPLGL